jgi:hypothetical protein
MQYVLEMGSGAMIYKFHKDWFRYSKVDKGGIHRQHLGKQANNMQYALPLIWVK